VGGKEQVERGTKYQEGNSDEKPSNSANFDGVRGGEGGGVSGGPAGESRGVKV